MKFTSKKALYLFILMILGYTIYKALLKEDLQVLKTENISLSIETFKIDDGWRFYLIKNEKIIISQDYVPAVNGKQYFKTKEDAKKVAELMKYKIEKNIFPPSVSLQELDSLNINYSL